MNLPALIISFVFALGLWSFAAFATAQDSFGSTPAPRTQAPPTPTRPASPPNGNRPSPMRVRAGHELQDMGVAATDQLKTAPLHAPTPTTIPGGRTVTTGELAQLLKAGPSGALVFDVLGAAQTLPNAFYAAPAAQPGDFNDQVQRDFGNFLQQTTQGNRDVPMVFYCQNDHCWMSYNAALRAIKLGYRKVYWYRGGIEAWQRAGGSLVTRSQGAPTRQQ